MAGKHWQWLYSPASATISRRRQIENGGGMAGLRKSYEIRAEWDAEAGVWWCSNNELPLTTEAPTFEQLVARVLEIAPEIAAENGLAAPGEEIELHVIAERVEAVPVVAAA
jgi:hypothetical protein